MFNEKAEIHSDDPDYQSYTPTKAREILLRLLIIDEMVEKTTKVDSKELLSKASEILHAYPTFTGLPHRLGVFAFIALCDNQESEEYLNNFFYKSWDPESPKKEDFLIDVPGDDNKYYAYWKVLALMWDRF